MSISVNSSAALRVLLAGVGDLNTHAGLRLQAQGHHVTGIRRSQETRPLPFSVLAHDLTTTQNPGDLPQADAVVVALTADSSDAEGYTRAYRDTLRGLAAGLKAPPQRVIFVSSTSVLGDQQGQTVTEEALPQPERETAQVLLRAEEDVRALFPHSKVTILRPAGIYGPGRTRTINRVLQQKPADHSRWTNRIHRDDLVSTIAALLHLAAPPALLHAVDREPAPLGTVLQYLAQHLGTPTPPDSGTGQPGGKRLDASALHQLLGENGLAYPTFREGYAPLLEAHRKSGA